MIASALTRIVGGLRPAAAATPVLSPAALRRHAERVGAALLNQQCWLWGCDVRRESGNLLLQYGFARVRPPGSAERSTQYTLLRGELVIRLWGSGVYSGTAQEGHYVNRFVFQPRYAPHEADCWQDPAALKRGPLFWDGLAMARLCAWIAEYEAYVLQSCGVGYRRNCLSSFQESVSQPEEIAAEWRRLALTLDPSLAAGPVTPAAHAVALNPLTAIAGC